MLFFVGYILSLGELAFLASWCNEGFMTVDIPCSPGHLCLQSVEQLYYGHPVSLHKVKTTDHLSEDTCIYIKLTSSVPFWCSELYFLIFHSGVCDTFPTLTSISIGLNVISILIVTPVLNIPVVDPCHNYTVLDEPWRATNYTADKTHCDSQSAWHGWYRLLYHGQTIRMPEQCLPSGRCGTSGPLWMNGTHPRLQDGVVTRKMCKSVGMKCCFDRAPPIQVKACPGNYYVYQLVVPNGCYFAYCAGKVNIVFFFFNWLG